MALFGGRKQALSVPSQAAPASAAGGGADLGPLGPVVRGAIDGTLPVAAACERAAELGAAGSVTRQQLEQLSDAAFRQATVRQAAAWSLAQILYAAADAAWTQLHDEDSGAALVVVCADLVAVAAAGLTNVGDIRWFATARSVADRGLAVAGELGMQSVRGVLLQRLGGMFLECYTNRRTPAGYEAEFRLWIDAAVSGGDPGLLAIVASPAGQNGPDAAYRWPAPLAAMDLAEQYLREALPLVEPARRGRVLKGLSQVLEWRPIFGGPADPGQLITVCQQALKALPADDVQGRLAVSQTLELALARSSGPGGPDAAGPAPDVGGLGQGSEALIEQLESDWARYLAQVLPLQAWDAVNQAVALLADGDPARALRLLALHRDITSLWADDARRREDWRLEIQLIAISHATGWVQQLWESEDQFTATAARVLAEAEQRAAAGTSQPAGTPAPDPAALTGSLLAGALTTVMMASTKFEQEGTGLRALEVLQRIGGKDWDDHADAYADLAAALRVGEGINCEARGEADRAIALFLDSATRYLTMESAGALVTSLGYISDVIAKGGNLTGLSDVSRWCGVFALRAEMLSPHAAPAALQRLADLTLAYQVQHGTSVEEMCLLMAAVKGRRFASLLASGTTGYTPDPGAVQLLADVAAAEQRLPAGRSLLGGPDWEDKLDREILVTAYASEFETSPARTPADEVVNLQRAAERRIMAQLAMLGDTNDLPVILSAIRAALDSRTAVLLVREGRWTDGMLATYCLLVTDTDAFADVANGECPWAIVSLSADGRTTQVPPAGPFVAAVRRAVQEEPAPRDISKQGEQLLETTGQSYARPLFEHLAELRAGGRDRLLVVPHAASHFLPVHLAGPSGHLLADGWTVTYLASLAQLRPGADSGPDAPSPRRDGAAVFALGYADQPGLPALDSSAAEASAIGGILGVQPALDDAATERAFVRALETRRYVHLRAHGRHNVDAPLFQTVFLAPGDGGDGQLRAHEVLGLDLRGLELVTLGACETALGRIDLSDNLRGLPAELLLAGAEAVIGTLWEVSAEASTTFFTQLYQCLRADDQDLIGAFGVAQRATRAAHPEYRDWGAFYLTGGYRKTRSADRA